MISVAWVAAIISVPISYLTPLPPGPTGGDRYKFDVDQFRLDLRTLEATNGDGMAFPNTHNHETETILGGATYARKVEVLPPYVVEFENGTYEVNCVGANHNVADRKVVSSVSINPNNSAGLIREPLNGENPRYLSSSGELLTPL